MQPLDASRSKMKVAALKEEANKEKGLQTQRQISLMCGSLSD